MQGEALVGQKYYSMVLSYDEIKLSFKISTCSKLQIKNNGLFVEYYINYAQDEQ